MVATFIYLIFVSWFIGLFVEAVKDFTKIGERTTYRNNFLRRAKKHLKDNTCDPEEIDELEQDLRECENYKEMQLCFMVWEESHSYPYCK